ncbi:hypothetical protein FQA39_LY15186 [Lamprigera yunnana]|nr:hypothetical protein FQA39_LY15186 [Lamprigera yunnana]
MERLHERILIYYATCFFFHMNFPTSTISDVRNPEKSSREAVGTQKVVFDGMFDFKDKIALVTGSASGIGFQLVKELLRNGVKGASVVDIDAEQGATAKKELSEEFGAERVVFYHCDVTKSDKLKDVFESSFKHWGGLDILIGNAGMCKEQKWETMISLNCVIVQL